MRKDPVTGLLLGLMTPVLKSVAGSMQEGKSHFSVVCYNMWIGFRDPKSTVSTRCIEQSVSTVRVVAWIQIFPLKIACIAKWIVLPAAKTLRFVSMRNRTGDLAGSVGNRIRIEMNCPLGY